MRPTEDLDSVIQRLSVFGPIKSVSLCGRQSAVVVFEHTVSACSTVNAFQSRTPGTVFQCAWQQRFIVKDVRLLTTKNLRKFSKLVSHHLFFIRALVKYNYHNWYFSTEKRHSEVYLVQELESRNSSTSLPWKRLALMWWPSQLCFFGQEAHDGVHALIWQPPLPQDVAFFSINRVQLFFLRISDDLFWNSHGLKKQNQQWG